MYICALVPLSAQELQDGSSLQDSHIFIEHKLHSAILGNSIDIHDIRDHEQQGSVGRQTKQAERQSIVLANCRAPVVE